MADSNTPAGEAESLRPVVSAGNLVINFSNFRVAVGGAAVALSFQEFELLRALTDNIDRVISNDTLTDLMWHATGRTYVRRLNVVVHRLRVKLLGSAPYQIESVRGRGYGLIPLERDARRGAALGGARTRRRLSTAR
jgi:DNA-binding response OmpR family regulator